MYEERADRGVGFSGANDCLLCQELDCRFRKPSWRKTSRLGKLPGRVKPPSTAMSWPVM